jgi:ketosteroid isomerase-like protein
METGALPRDKSGAAAQEIDLETLYQKETPMKRILSLVTLTVFATFISSCTAPEEKASSSPAPSAAATASPTENVEQVLTKLEQDWAEALVKGDVATIDRIVADDFIATLSDGKSETKAQHIEAVKSGAYKVEFMNLDEIKVHVFGDTAVVTLRQTEKSKTNGKDNSGWYRFTDTWIKRNGKWQIVADHGCKVEPPKPKV